jgi:nucleoside-diphosphate-sugar epimerase
MIYVGDAIAGLLFAAERPDRTCNPFRIGAIDTNGAPNPEDTRAEPQPVAGIGIPRRLGNIERFGEWVPKTNFEDGLRKTLDDRNR